MIAIRVFFLICALVSQVSTNLFGQNIPCDSVYTMVDEAPMFKNGYEDLAFYISGLDYGSCGPHETVILTWTRFAFDNLTPKDTILKLFINEVYLGENEGRTIKGFENASNSYFKKSFNDLTWDEYLSIVAMIRAPMTYHYAKNREANQNRVVKIKRMLAGEYTPIDNSDWLYDRR